MIDLLDVERRRARRCAPSVRATIAIADAGAQRRAPRRSDVLGHLATVDLRAPWWYATTGSTTSSTRRRGGSTAPATAGASLYRAALAELDDANATLKIIGASEPAEDSGARGQLAARPSRSSSCCTARSTTSCQSDFYSYRYFAVEGFLPGYSFPRLPLSAFIPARGGPARRRTSTCSGPGSWRSPSSGRGALIYHEGARYQVNRVILPAARTTAPASTSPRPSAASACGYLHDADGRRPRRLRALRRAARRRH